MDPPLRNSRTLTPNATNPIPYPPRTSSYGGAGEGNSRSGGTTGEALRRLHSDGEVSTSGPGLHGTMMPESTVADGETWMDFLRHSPALGQLTPEQIRIAKGRAALIAADRKRRLSEQQEDHSRRRSASNISIGQIDNHRMRQSLSQATRENPLMANPLGGETHSGQRITDRPLPRRPSFGMLGDRRSQEFTPPRWQPDHEVSACPICGTQFSLLYRRHHCRKCGRVVCAGCSPHRITIPRQFIVRSPPEVVAMQSARTAMGPEVVDLTGDSDVTALLSHHPQRNARPQSHGYRINNALGGGEEVRLCNPCVPDPNPLPHVAYPSSVRYGLDPLAGSGRVPQIPDRPSSGSFSASTYQGPPLARRVSSDRLDRHNASEATPNTVLGQLPGDSSFLPGPAIDRRHSHASRPVGRVPQPPPNYQSLFGSAPEPPLDDVSLYLCLFIEILNYRQSYLQSLLERHGLPQPRHRHQTSTVDVPAHPRYRSILGVEAPPALRAVPRPMLREEDECPICHSALPPKGPDGSETAREAHVTLCIESHFSSSTPRSFHPPPPAAIAASVAASAATPLQAGASSVYRSEGIVGMMPPSSMPRRRTTGMVVYRASEKDCIGDGGEGSQECVICYEEFAVGDEMGRLECLCKFHKVRELRLLISLLPTRFANQFLQACIRRWWDTKGVGACPVHQGGL